MIKIVYIFIMFIFTTNLMSQNKFETFITNDTLFEKQSKIWIFENVVKIDTNIKKDIIFSALQNWFINTNYITDFYDKENGKMVVIGTFDVSVKYLGDFPYGYVTYTINIQVKDGRFKYLINNFNYHRDAAKHGIAEDDNGKIIYKNLINYKDPGASMSFDEPKFGLTMTKKYFNQIQNQTKRNTYYVIDKLIKSIKYDIIKNDSW